MNRAAVAAIAFLLLSSALACSSSGNSTGAGGTTGSAGTTGGGGAGGNGTFMAVAPCSTEASYTQGTTTITFGGNPDAGVTDISYMPKCLKVGTGATVTFTGDFSTHPLSPSAMRGTTTGNPITNVSAGTTKTFTFPAAGYYAYFCTVHGASDGAGGMVGVIWVQ